MLRKAWADGRAARARARAPARDFAMVSVDGGVGWVGGLDASNASACAMLDAPCCMLPAIGVGGGGPAIRRGRPCMTHRRCLLACLLRPSAAKKASAPQSQSRNEKSRAQPDSC